MEKITNIVLDNGLKLIIVENNKKHRSQAKIIINAGGNNISYKKDNKIHNLDKGIAHFLEHYLIEKSSNGNMGEYYSKESINFNGVTYPERTEFYISTVHDFIFNLKKLLNMVNHPVFIKENIESVKKPIIEEIKRSKDNIYRKENNQRLSAIYSAIPTDIILGEEDNIINMSIEEIEEFYNTFYTPSNEIISIYTNIDTDKIINIIKKEYKNIPNNNIEYIIPKEPLKLNKKELTIVNNKDDEFLEITFKIDISHLSTMERIKLDIYLDYFLTNNFDEKSPIFNELINNKQTLYSIENRYNFIINQDILLLSLTVYTNNYQIVQDKILNIINNLDYSKESFKIWHNNNIIDYVNNKDLTGFLNHIIIGNLIYNNLAYLTTLDDIKNLKYEEAIEYINKIKFDNYIIIKRIKEE